MPGRKPPTENQVEDAMRVLYRDYYEDVHGVAEQLWAYLEAGDLNSPEEAMERLEEIINDSQRVIYTAQAVRGIAVSEHDDALWDEGVYDPSLFEEGIPWSQLMFWAMRADVMRRIEAGVSVDQMPDPFDEATYEEE